MGLLLARLFVNLKVDESIGDGGENKLSLLGTGAAILVKGLEGTSLSCLTILALICSIPLLPCRTFILVYWLFLSNKPILQ